MPKKHAAQIFLSSGFFEFRLGLGLVIRPSHVRNVMAAFIGDRVSSHVFKLPALQRAPQPHSADGSVSRLGEFSQRGRAVYLISLFFEPLSQNVPRCKCA